MDDYASAMAIGGAADFHTIGARSIGQRIEAIARPEATGDGEPHGRLRGLRRIAFEVQPQQLAVLAVVEAAGDLDRPGDRRRPA